MTLIAQISLSAFLSCSAFGQITKPSNTLHTAIRDQKLSDVYRILERHQRRQEQIPVEAARPLWLVICSDADDRLKIPRPRTHAGASIVHWRGLARHAVWEYADSLRNEIIEAMKSPRQNIKREGFAASTHLKDHGGNACFEILNSQINDDNPTTRLAIIAAIGNHGSKSEEPLLSRIQTCIRMTKGTTFTMRDQRELDLICSVLENSNKVSKNLPNRIALLLDGGTIPNSAKLRLQKKIAKLRNLDD